MLRGDGLVALPGTVRALTPEQTWEAVAGRLPEFGITRVADLTGLDCVGLPVFTAIRPASLTLSTSQGKGATGLLAKLSAVMEAIELWHVEQPLPVAAYGPACEVAPGCPVTALPLTVPCPAHILARMVWEWTCGTGLVGGEKVLLPVDLVRRRVQRPQWSPDLLRATSTGLACGNSRDEALLHALFEVVERDVLYRDGQSGGRRRTLIAPGTVEDPHGREVVDRLVAAGMALEIALVDGPMGRPALDHQRRDHPRRTAGGPGQGSRQPVRPAAVPAANRCSVAARQHPRPSAGISRSRTSPTTAGPPPTMWPRRSGCVPDRSRDGRPRPNPAGPGLPGLAVRTHRPRFAEPGRSPRSGGQRMRPALPSRQASEVLSPQSAVDLVMLSSRLSGGQRRNRDRSAAGSASGRAESATWYEDRRRRP
ncbi:YcaO-like family protein [Frankia sp. Cas3]|uniref:YcaO-like family protein n=1 Tax=Frankia sp. Cas3 TaxID=3073926 RepID=UPI002AD4A5AA|nr:YcaO-like family protein [Frankia sp. Cas3]